MMYNIILGVQFTGLTIFFFFLFCIVYEFTDKHTSIIKTFNCTLNHHKIDDLIAMNEVVCGHCRYCGGYFYVSSVSPSNTKYNKAVSSSKGTVKQLRPWFGYTPIARATEDEYRKMLTLASLGDE